MTAVIFDLDGTLADTAPDMARTVNLMRERRGLAGQVPRIEFSQRGVEVVDIEGDEPRQPRDLVGLDEVEHVDEEGVRLYVATPEACARQCQAISSDRENGGFRLRDAEIRDDPDMSERGRSTTQT